MKLKKLMLFAAIAVFILPSCSQFTDKAERIKQAVSIRNLGEAYLAAGNATLALREFLNADGIYPDDPYTHNDLGLAYLAKKRKDKAIVHFKKAIELKPDYAPAVNHLGTTYLVSEKWDKAIETLIPLTKNILYANPHYAELNLAFAYFKKGDLENAEKRYKNSIELSPDFVTAIRGLSIVYREKREYEKSLKFIEKALKISPENGELYLQKGKTLKAMNKNILAKNAFKKALKLGDQNVADEAENFLTF